MSRHKRILVILVFAVVLIPLAKSGYNKLLDRFLPLKYEGYIEKYSEEYGLDKYLVMGVIRAESSFRNDAHSGVARGLMQLTDDTARWIAGKLDIDYNEDMVLKPEVNIKMGCYYLAYLKEHFKDTIAALAAYNAGMGNVTEWLGDSRYSEDGKTLQSIPFGETKRYVKRVEILSRLYEKLY